MSIAALALFMRIWQPKEVWEFPGSRDSQFAVRGSQSDESPPSHLARSARAWMPWLFLSIAVILWGLAPVKAFLNGGPDGLAAYRAGARPSVSRILSPTWNVPLLHRAVFRDYPVVPAAVDRNRITDSAYRNERAEAAVFTLNWVSATGTAILLAALATALFLRISIGASAVDCAADVRPHARAHSRRSC